MMTNNIIDCYIYDSAVLYAALMLKEKLDYE